MKSKEDEYKEIFLAEALENYEELNRLLTGLEKDNSDKKAVNAIFRITHTMKGNAGAMGFEKIAALAHVIEDVFAAVRDSKVGLTEGLFEIVYKAIDVLGALINALKDGKTVSYKGIKTKLEVFMRNAQKGAAEGVTKVTEGKTAKTTKTTKTTKITATKEPNKPEGPVTTEENQNKITFSDLVQVPVRKLDNLLNLVGELIIERDRIMASSGNGLQGSNEYSRLNRISSDLQYSVMDVRLVQVGFLFNKFHRVVRDAAADEGKKVALKLNGTETEIDRNILQIISDSLIHIIRNAVGHGIERADERKKLKKTAEGSITLSAKNESDAVIIEIADDGKGIDVKEVAKKAIAKGLLTEALAAQMSDEEVIMYIFEPDFSTQEQVNKISGRGVGMDVVKRAVDSIGGNILIDTVPGQGTTIKLSLPSSMAVKGTLLFELGGDEFAIPLSFTESVISLYKPDIHKVGKGLAATYLGKTISVVFLKDLFNLKPAGQNDSPNDGTNNGRNDGRNHGQYVLHNTFDSIHPEEKLDIVVVSYNNRMIGLVVDKLLQQKEIVEKPLMKPVDKVKFISGVTIMGNGNVCLVVNVVAINNYVFGISFSNQGVGNAHS